MDRRSQSRFSVACGGVQRVVNTRRPVLFLQGSENTDLGGCPNVKPFDENAVDPELEQIGFVLNRRFEPSTAPRRLFVLGVFCHDNPL